MLTLRSVSIAFGNHTLFTGLDLVVGRGQLVGITGESGCGKTSLLRAVLGFVPFTAGTAEVCGHPLDVAHIHEIRRQTAYVPQELQPLAEKGADLVSLTHSLEHNVPLNGARLLPAMMKSLGLEDGLLKQDATKLSGGQRQRLLLAAALALPKPLLLLDEPTSALDEDCTQRVALSLLRACHEEERAALVVSHDPILLSFCDQVIHL
ncbi:MAG: ABC transporter ATP-binding protein [Bacteroidaceae bacterium]|nr:ABC transporter ATP-binding protein [Bacteroidaceae bacterium]